MLVLLWLKVDIGTTSVDTIGSMRVSALGSCCCGGLVAQRRRRPVPVCVLMFAVTLFVFTCWRPCFAHAVCVTCSCSASCCICLGRSHVSWCSRSLLFVVDQRSGNVGAAEGSPSLGRRLGLDGGRGIIILDRTPLRGSRRRLFNSLVSAILAQDQDF